MPQALLLDLDGTVAVTQEQIFHCFRLTLLEHTGIHADRAAWSLQIGLPLEDIFASALDPAAGTPEFVGGLVRSYRSRTQELDAGIRLFPGMQEGLDRARAAGVRLAIVTSKHSSIVTRHLPILGIESAFEVVVTGDRCRRLKPDPESFLLAAELLGVAPEYSIACGDTRHDILAARAAGMRAVAACWGTENRALLLSSEPHHVAETPGDLFALVGC